MATKTRKPRTSGDPARRADQLDEAAFKRTPRCQCRNHGGQCRRRATFRVSDVCTEDDCGVAVRVRLQCAICKDGWLEHVRTCSNEHRVRVTAL